MITVGVDCMLRIHELRTNKDITQKDLAAELGIPANTFNQYENGKREPDYETLKKVADYFHVPVDFLLGQTDEISCNECGFFYSPLTQNDEHEKYHSKWKKAVDKFGFCWDYREADNLRLKCIKIINDKKSTEKEIIDSFDDFLRAEFSLSLRNSGFDLSHVSFDEFCSIYLGKWESKDAVSEVVYQKLIDKYGIDNSSHYHLSTNKKPVSEEDRLRKENYDLFDQLPKDKQQEALNYLRFLVEHQEKE
jgi:transcriptional regulator with XRE-family HTH domain